MPYPNTPEGRAKKRERAAIYRDKYRERLRIEGRVRAAKRYSANPEEGRLRAKAWRTQNALSAKLASARWRAKSRTHLLGYVKRRRKSNPELFKRYLLNQKTNNPNFLKLQRARGQRYYQKDPARKSAYRKQWRRSNPDKARLEKYRRRTMELSASGCFTYDQMIARVTFVGWACRYCRTPLTMLTLTIDHMKPLSRGGSNWPSNLTPACRSCNSRKSNKTFHEFQPIIASAANFGPCVPSPNGPPVSSLRLSR